MSETAIKEINSSTINFVKNKVCVLKDVYAQKKAYVFYVATKVLADYFEEIEISSLESSFGYSNAFYINNYNLAVLHLNNGLKLGICVSFGSQTHDLLINSDFFNNSALPDYIIGASVDKIFSKVSLLGGIESQNIDKKRQYKKYTLLNIQDFEPLDSLKTKLLKAPTKNGDVQNCTSAHFKNSFFTLIESDFSLKENPDIFTHFLKCETCRKDFDKFVLINSTLKQVSENFESITSNSLEILTEEAPLENEGINYTDDEAESDIDIEEYAQDEQLNLVDEETNNLTLIDNPEFFNDLNEDHTNIDEDKIVQNNETIEEIETFTLQELAGSSSEKKEEPPSIESLNDNFKEQKNNTDQTPISIREDVSNTEETLDIRLLDEGTFVFNPDKKTVESKIEIHKEEVYTELKDEADLGKNSLSETIEDDNTTIESETKYQNSQKESPEETEHNELLDILKSLDEVEVVGEEDDISSMLTNLEAHQKEWLMKDNSVAAKISDANNTPKVNPPSEETITNDAFISDEVTFPQSEPKPTQTPNDSEEVFVTEPNSAPENKQELFFDPDSVNEHNTEQKQAQKHTVQDGSLLFTELQAEEDDLAVQESNEELLELVREIVEESHSKNASNKGSRKVKKEQVWITLGLIGVGLTLTTYFIILSQVNHQVQMSNSQKNMLEDIKKMVTNKQSSEAKVEPKTRRAPMQYYTREVVKTVEKPDKDINTVLSKAFTPQKQEVIIRNVSWEVGASLVKNEEMKDFFIFVGNNLKTSLAQELLKAEEKAINERLVLSLKIDKQGNLENIDVLETTEASQIDEICINSLKKAINMAKLPTINNKEDSITVKLLITL